MKQRHLYYLSWFILGLFSLDAVKSVYTPVNPNQVCSNGWTYITGYCFKSFTNSMTWNDAKSDCESQSTRTHQGSLMKVRDQTQMNFLRATDTTSDVWVSLKFNKFILCHKAYR